MTEQKESIVGRQGGSLRGNVERLWNEIKQISRQVERETRRSGRVTRLRLDIRKLRRQLVDVQARLGKAVYEAQRTGGPDLRLEDVEGLGGGVAALDRLEAQIRDKEQEIEHSRAPSAPAAPANGVTGEATSH